MSKMFAAILLGVAMLGATTAAKAQPVTWCLWPYNYGYNPLTCPYPYYDGPYPYVGGPYYHGPIFHRGFHGFHGRRR